MLPTEFTKAVLVVLDKVAVVVVLGPLWALEAVGTAMVTHDKRVGGVSSIVEAIVVVFSTGPCFEEMIHKSVYNLEDFSQ